VGVSCGIGWAEGEDCTTPTALGDHLLDVNILHGNGFMAAPAVEIHDRACARALAGQQIDSI